jgi:hypothetical protein
MKRKISIIISVLFVATITTVFLMPPSVHSIWYGSNNPPMVGPPFDAEALHEDLMNGPIRQLRTGFFTFNNNPLGTLGVTPGLDTDKAWSGYTLLGLLQGKICDDAGAPPHDYGDVCGAVLIDMDGAIVKEWRLGGFPAKMLPGGSVMGSELPFHQLTGVPLVQMDWCGNEEWRWDGNPDDAWYGPNQVGELPGLCDPAHLYSISGSEWCENYSPCLDPDDPYSCISGFHHDYQREGNPVGYYAPGLKPSSSKGKTLILSNYVPPTEQTDGSLTDADGVSTEACLEEYDKCYDISDKQLYDEAIYEVDWDGTVLFKWFAFEHFEEMGFDDDAKEAIETIRVGSPNSEDATDYQHFNAVSYVGENYMYDEGDLRFHPENIITDARSNNITLIIARYDHPDGETWKSGDVVWKIGPDYSIGKPEHKLGQIIGQHHAHIIPVNLPGAGNMMIYDNQGMAGFGRLLPGLPPTNPNKFGDVSRVIEFNPVTLDIVWEYVNVVDCTPSATPPFLPVCAEETDGTMNRKHFSAFLSSAQRLKNGNTLITEGLNGRVFEVTVEGEVVWEHYSDYSNLVGSGIPAGVAAGAVYRAYRVPYKWAPKKMECPAP